MYSLGVSEEITGRALRSMAKLDEIVIATKVFSPMNDRPNMAGLSRKHIVQGCETSLKRLGIETIDLYQIHRFDPVTPIEETLAALDHLVQSGKVRYIGASSGPAWEMMRALGTSDRHGWTRFVSMQNHYNLLYREEEREMLPALPQPETRGASVVAARARTAQPSAREEQRRDAALDERHDRRPSLRQVRLGHRRRRRADRERPRRVDGADRAGVAVVETRGHGPDRRRDEAEASRGRRRRIGRDAERRRDLGARGAVHDEAAWCR